MGNIIVSSALSIDGYTEGAGGNIMEMPLDMAFGKHNADLVRRANSLLFGATTFRGMTQYWPAQVDNPDATEDDRYIARRYAEGMPITVVSDTITAEDTAPWTEQTTVVRRADTETEIARLRKEDGDALIFGSRTLWTDLLRRSLVDTLYLLVGPKIVAGDKPAFAGVPQTNLTLVDARQLENSDLVLLEYSVPPKT